MAEAPKEMTEVEEMMKTAVALHAKWATECEKGAQSDREHWQNVGIYAAASVSFLSHYIVARSQAGLCSFDDNLNGIIGDLKRASLAARTLGETGQRKNP